MKFQIAALTDTGNIRTKNEDSLIICRKMFGRTEVVMAAVADGMGGLDFGDRASKCVISCLERWWQEAIIPAETLPDVSQLCDLLGFVLETANACVCEEAQECNTSMGTTLTMLFLWDEFYMVFQVGDSRAYLIDKEMYRITVDQTWCQEEVEAGRMTTEEAKNHERRHVLSNAFGRKEKFYFEKNMGQIKRGQRILICSDGYYTYLEPQELKKKGIFGKNVQEVLKMSGKRIKQGKAEDNFTAILLEAE